MHIIMKNHVCIRGINLDNHFTPKEIKSLRKELKLTQSEFARKLKIDVITVSRWELGKQRPQQAVLKRLQRLHKKNSHE